MFGTRYRQMGERNIVLVVKMFCNIDVTLPSSRKLATFHPDSPETDNGMFQIQEGPADYTNTT